MGKESQPKKASAYMSVEDYEAAIAASVKQDENGNPIPNFDAVKGALVILHEDGSRTFKRPQGKPKGFIDTFLEELAKGKK